MGGRLQYYLRCQGRFLKTVTLEQKPRGEGGSNTVVGERDIPDYGRARGKGPQAEAFLARPRKVLRPTWLNETLIQVKAQVITQGWSTQGFEDYLLLWVKAIFTTGGF